ncbi:hypothetical protein Tco_0283861 [Tanacetum coccineum]
MDGTDWIFLRPGRPIMSWYGDGYLTTIKFIKALVECSPSLKDTISEIFLNGQDISPLNPKSGAVAGIIQLLTFGRSLLKHYSYNTSDADPLSTYMWWIRWSSNSASITIRFSCLSLFERGGKETS